MRPTNLNALVDCSRLELEQSRWLHAVLTFVKIGVRGLSQQN